MHINTFFKCVVMFEVTLALTVKFLLQLLHFPSHFFTPRPLCSMKFKNSKYCLDGSNRSIASIFSLSALLGTRTVYRTVLLLLVETSSTWESSSDSIKIIPLSSARFGFTSLEVIDVELEGARTYRPEPSTFWFLIFFVGVGVDGIDAGADVFWVFILVLEITQNTRHDYLNTRHTVHSRCTMNFRINSNENEKTTKNEVKIDCYYFRLLKACNSYIISTMCQI